MTWKTTYQQKVIAARDALCQTITPGSRILLNANCGEPLTLGEALAEVAPQLQNVEVIQLLAKGAAPYMDPRFYGNLRFNTMFIGPAVRQAVATGDADFTPIFLSDVPRLFLDKKMPLDMAMIQVSPPDAHGYCSFGVSVDIIKTAAETARLVVAEVNKQMPRTLGDSFIHVDKITHLVESDRPILELPRPPINAESQAIARHIAPLIEDGATLQIGIGALPEAVLSELRTRRDLGVHSEMFSDGVMDLVEAGVITGARKNLNRGKVVASFLMGTRKLFDWVHDNPAIEMHPTLYTNDPLIIGQQDNMISINSALSVDLTGQVNADSIGTSFYSGFGGQVDFVRGAKRSKNGKSFIALPATAKNGTASRIVPTLAGGAGVTTSRGDVHYVVTEYGLAELHGKSVRERTRALIQIAHPQFRAELEKKAYELLYLK